MYLMGELVKRLEMPQLDVVILNQASLLQRFNIIRTYQLLYQRDQKGRVQFEMRAVMDWLEFRKYEEMQTKALAERIRGERYAVDAAYVRKRGKCAGGRPGPPAHRRGARHPAEPARRPRGVRAAGPPLHRPRARDRMSSPPLPRESAETRAQTKLKPADVGLTEHEYALAL